jgi:hypothetical protein
VWEAYELFHAVAESFAAEEAFKGLQTEPVVDAE